MKRLYVAVVLMVVFSALSTAQEIIQFGAFEKVAPSDRINNRGNAEVWFAMQWYSDELKRYTWTICVARNPELFEIINQLEQKTNLEPFSQIIRVKGRLIKSYNGWERMLITEINWLKWRRISHKAYQY